MAWLPVVVVVVVVVAATAQQVALRVALRIKVGQQAMQEPQGKVALAGHPLLHLVAQAARQLAALAALAVHTPRVVRVAQQMLAAA